VSKFANLCGAKYMSLATLRKDGREVRTPVWFAESERGVVLFTNPGSGKVKRIRRNPQVRLAPCTARGTVTGEWAEGRARFLEGDEGRQAWRAIKKKYWLARLPIWWRSSAYLEIASA
jgi:PPOX class probable F420-dependent enzyme